MKKFGKNFGKKKFEKNRENFFFDFPKFFSVEIFHMMNMMSRLRIQNFAIIGQGVPEISVRTDTRTNYFSNIDVRSTVFEQFLMFCATEI